MIDGKKVEAKAAVPRNSGSGNSLTKKMFVGGTVRLNPLLLVGPSHNHLSYMVD